MDAGHEGEIGLGFQDMDLAWESGFSESSHNTLITKIRQKSHNKFITPWSEITVFKPFTASIAGD